MAHHEPKFCPRCNSPFECKAGSILLCQCSGLDLNIAEWDYIRLTYTDCLCRQCLLSIKYEINIETTKQRIQAILAPIKKK